jgi:S1-C subfamily serine protease
MSDPSQPTSFYSPEPRYRPAWAEPFDESTEPAWTSPEARQGTGPNGPLPPPRRSPSPIGPLVAVGLLSAILGSGGTYVLLASSGQVDKPAVAAATGTPAPTTAAPAANIGTTGGIVDAASKVSPAVVTITSVQDFDPSSGNVPQVGVGSGVIFDAKGWILTNCHVVKGGSTLTVDLQDGRSFTGSLYGIDTLTDLAIVKVDATGLPAAGIGDSSKLQPGQDVLAIGSPLGTYTNSVTSGIVSALGRSIVAQGPEGCNDNLHNLIQTDAAINFGNSGGALADSAAALIGINTALAAQAQGIGFAIPINIAKPIMTQALAGKPLARPYMGIRYVGLDPKTAAEQKLTIDFGAFLTPSSDGSDPAVVPGGPADKAGLKEKDIITAIDGTRIDAKTPLEDLLAQHQPGDTISLEVVRDGRTMTVSLTLGTRPAGV